MSPGIENEETLAIIEQMNIQSKYVSCLSCKCHTCNIRLNFILIGNFLNRPLIWIRLMFAYEIYGLEQWNSSWSNVFGVLVAECKKFGWSLLGQWFCRFYIFSLQNVKKYNGIKLVWAHIGNIIVQNVHINLHLPSLLMLHKHLSNVHPSLYSER